MKNWFFLLALFCLVACGRTESSLPGARRLAAQWSLAEAGLSCDEACADQGMACSENFWPTDSFEFEDIVSDVGAECVAFIRLDSSSALVCPLWYTWIGFSVCAWKSDASERCPYSPESDRRRFCPCVHTTTTTSTATTSTTVTFTTTTTSTSTTTTTPTSCLPPDYLHGANPDGACEEGIVPHLGNCSLSCAEGYLPTHASLFCNYGTLLPKHFDCLAECSAPSIEKATLDCDPAPLLEGTTCTIHCDAGYELLGSPQMSCEVLGFPLASSGTFVVSAVCRARECGDVSEFDPHMVQGASASPAVVGDTRWVSCHEGYRPAPGGTMSLLCAPVSDSYGSNVAQIATLAPSSSSVSTKIQK